MAHKDNMFSFLWKIENFSMLPHQFGEKLDSQAFVIDKLKKVDLCLWLYPMGSQKHDYISVFLCKEQKDVDLKLDISFTIESTEPLREITKSAENIVFKDLIGYAKFAGFQKVFGSKLLYLPQDTLTLRCDINPIEETSEKLSVNKELMFVPTFFKKSCVSRSTIEVQRGSITWSIRNMKEHIDKLEDASITLKSALKNIPSLKLTMVFNTTSSDDFIQILIKQTCLALNKERLFVKCKITLTSAHEDFRVLNESTHLFKLDISDVWNFSPFIKDSMLKDENYHFVDDTLLFRCEFAFSYKDKTHHLDNFYMPFSYESTKNSHLSKCLEKIYYDEKFCDIELKTDDRTFPYYKLLLCARSPVFSAMFENDMKEKNTNVVEIDDVDTKTVDMMLTYMHSDVLEEDLSTEDACKLYAAADKYDIDTLKRSCTAFLMSKLSVDSVCEILTLADVHQNGLLMTAAGEFISNHSNEVLFSKQWKSLMEDHPTLTSMVMHQILTGKYRL